MLSDDAKIILVVCVPIAFFAIAIAVGLAFKFRSRKSRGRPELEAQKSTSSFGHPGSQSSLALNNSGVPGMPGDDVPPVPRIPSMYFRDGEQATSQLTVRRQTMVLPHFGQKPLDIRRMSALPQDDTRQRVTSVTSTLTAAPSSDALGGTNTSALGTTAPKTPKPIGVVDSNRRFSSVAARRNDAAVDEAQEELVLSPMHGIKVKVQSHPSSPYSPRDKRFSIHVSLNLPDHPPTETTSASCAPHGFSAPRTARPGVQAASDEKRLILQLPNPTGTPISAKGQGGLSYPDSTPSSAGYFENWAGFDKPAIHNTSGSGQEPSLAVTTSPDQAQPPIKERRSLSSGRITYLADVVEENERRKEQEAEAHAAAAVHLHSAHVRGEEETAIQQRASIVPPKMAIPQAVVRPAV